MNGLSKSRTLDSVLGLGSYFFGKCKLQKMIVYANIDPSVHSLAKVTVNLFNGRKQVEKVKILTYDLIAPIVDT